MPRIGRRTALVGGIAIGGSPSIVSRLVDPGPRHAAALVRSRITQPYAARAGDVTTHSAVVWARGGGEGRLMVRLESNGRRIASVRGGHASAGNDFTGRVLLTGLAPGRDYDAVTWFAHPDGTRGEPRTTSFRTAPVHEAPTSLVWSGDTCGQGWGINEAIGGLTGYRTVLELRPDLFVHCGDNIYADEPMEERTTDAHGNAWTNLLDDSVVKVAETLEDFRGRHRYVLQDENVRALYEQVPTVAMWDDHETLNNWYPGEVLDDPRYRTERRCDVLAARGRRAWQEYMPLAPVHLGRAGRVYRKVARGPHLDVFCLDMRSYRDANGENRSTDPERGILGWEQEQWLLRELTLSRATWKVVVADMPLSVATSRADDRDSVAQTNPGAPLGRELEIARLLSGLKANRVRNVVWLTADVHYTAAHHFDPERASFTGFDPFWEFVAGPIASGTFMPKVPDATFGPQVVFSKGNTDDGLRTMSPAVGNQFVGQLEITSGGRMTVTLHSVGEGALWSRTLEPAR